MGNGMNKVSLFVLGLVSRECNERGVSAMRVHARLRNVFVALRRGLVACS